MIGERLRTLREERGQTQAEIAREIGIKPTTLSGYERGARAPDLDTLIALAALFGVSADYLLGRTDIKHTTTLSDTQLAAISPDDIERYGDMESEYRDLAIRIEIARQRATAEAYDRWVRERHPDKGG